MYVVCVTFHVIPDALDRFLPRMHQQARDSLDNEDGCHRFDVCYDQKNPNTIFLYEVYESRSAFDLHNVSAHFLSFAADTASLTSGKEVSTFDTVSVGQSS